MYEQFFFFSLVSSSFISRFFCIFLKSWFLPLCLIQIKAVSSKVDPKQCYFFTLPMHYFDYVLYIDHGLLFSKYACGLEQ